jgi:L-threonylcarbamoyladenylate synthase
MKMEDLLFDTPTVIAKLKSGNVGVIPTDTVYGLVARAHDKEAVARLYALKNRDHKPGTVIAASVEQLIELGVDKAHLDRVKRWWPASLSVETPLSDGLSYLHQGTGRQGFRVVADEAVREILLETGPLVTSSANHPGEPGSVTVQEAWNYFKDAVDFYLDGGDRTGRSPSTIAKITDDGLLEIIRDGAVKIPKEALGERK